MKPAKTPAKKASARAKPIVIGREAWRKISAVEGVVLSKEAKAMIEEFDRLGLSAEERRRRIIAKYTRLGRTKS